MDKAANARPTHSAGAPGATVPQPANSNWHHLRKRIHLVCFLVFAALPFLNVIRFDIPRQRFYFAGRELWINEFGIVFFALMFLMFLVVAGSVFYGRVYCGYLCPQMIFSEASTAFEAYLRRRVVKRFIHWKPKSRERLLKAILYAALAAASVVLAFLFIAYFVEPRDLFRRLVAFDLHTAAGIAGASVTLLTFLDLTLVRLHFCTTVCPYGYLQGMLGDGHTLLVHYRDEGHACIECKKCVRVCPMGIDIRESPFQIECVHCGECIDACREILARVNQPGLIHYTWGEKGELAGAATGRSWFHRIGIRDAKRVVVLLVLAFYACGLSVALSMRREVLVRVSPDRSELYRAAGDQIANRFRYSIANRGGQRVEVRFTVEQLPGGVVGGGSVPIAAPAGESVSGEFEILAPRAGLREQVSHFTIAATSIPQQEIERIPMTFLAPGEGK